MGKLHLFELRSGHILLDALIYKGSFKAAGEITKGTATTTDGWKTCTFSAGAE